MHEPIVDAVEVVRCKDCAFADDAPLSDGLLWCNHFGTAMLEYEFCSHGMKKEENAE